MEIKTKLQTLIAPYILPKTNLLNLWFRDICGSEETGGMSDVL